MNEQNVNATKIPGRDANPDPLTGAPGAHPVGTGLGAIGAGAAAGAAGGAVAGPVGAVIGAVAGAVAGGIVGKAAAEAVNPTVETKYWRETYTSRPYAEAEVGFDEYSSAYRYGWESYTRHGVQGRSFESVEAELGRNWSSVRGTSKLGWQTAKEASRDAWNRLKDAAALSTGRS